MSEKGQWLVTSEKRRLRLRVRVAFQSWAVASQYVA